MQKKRISPTHYVFRMTYRVCTLSGCIKSGIAVTLCNLIPCPKLKENSAEGEQFSARLVC